MIMDLQPLSKSMVSRVALLRHKKYRKEYGVFTAEGVKCVKDLADQMKLRNLILLADEWHYLSDAYSNIDKRIICMATAEQMKKMSQMSTPPSVIGVFELPDYSLESENIDDSLALMLDGVQDPGNVGTIIRIADWFGVKNVICSIDCADVWSSKAVQATMGALARVRVVYTNLSQVIDSHPALPVCGLLLEGKSIYGAKLPKKGFIVMGSEGHGVSDEVRKRLSLSLLIPSYPPGEATSESLNVGAATAITLAEFRRRML